MVKIENSVPFEDDKPFPGRKHRRSKYPFWNMAIGDSVFYQDAAKAEQARQAAHVAQKRSNDERVFRSKKVDGGLRIWRVS